VLEIIEPSLSVSSHKKHKSVLPLLVSSHQRSYDRLPPGLRSQFRVMGGPRRQPLAPTASSPHSLSGGLSRSPRSSRPRRYASASPRRRSDQPKKTLTFT
ncbi:hypothetical protein Hamer_G021364, partial [Homarus americanus]